MKYFLSTILLLTSLYALSGHHATNEGLMPVAKPGQIIVTYKGECPADKTDESIAIVKQTIAYERKNSPVSVFFFTRCLVRWNSWRRRLTRF